MSTKLTNTPSLSYSKIIASQNYNKIMTEQHLYIALADREIVKTIERETATKEKAQVVEVGCGPGRLLQHAAKIPNICLTAIDVDEEFLGYSREITQQFSVSIKSANVENYQHDSSVDIFYSQGVHHHIKKGKDTFAYLQNLYTQLKSGGCYVLGDEFIPHYSNEIERDYCLVVWYSHVIAHALNHRFDYLAREEAKTLLDDIREGHPDEAASVKNEEQIELVLAFAKKISQVAESDNKETLKSLIAQFFTELKCLFNTNFQGDSTIDLSRGDYKICHEQFQQEVEHAGFVVENRKTFGPVDNIGGMCVYILRKE